MVTKQAKKIVYNNSRSVLAKIHMVTKRLGRLDLGMECSVLAKIHMVTKPQKYGSTFLNVIEY